MVLAIDDLKFIAFVEKGVPLEELEKRLRLLFMALNNGKKM